jgi:hypothetical protein
VVVLYVDRTGSFSARREVRDAAEGLETRHAASRESQGRSRGSIATEQAHPFERDIGGSVASSGLAQRTAKRLMEAGRGRPADVQLHATPDAPSGAGGPKSRRARKSVNEIHVLGQARPFT